MATVGQAFIPAGWTGSRWPNAHSSWLEWQRLAKPSFQPAGMASSRPFQPTVAIPTGWNDRLAGMATVCMGKRSFSQVELKPCRLFGMALPKGAERNRLEGKPCRSVGVALPIGWNGLRALALAWPNAHSSQLEWQPCRSLEVASPIGRNGLRAGVLSWRSVHSSRAERQPCRSFGVALPVGWNGLYAGALVWPSIQSSRPAWQPCGSFGVALPIGWRFASMPARWHGQPLIPNRLE